MNKDLSYKDLDHILKQLKQANDNNLDGISTIALHYLNDSYTEEEKEMIINKLLDDELIIMRNSNRKRPYTANYYIAFEGMLLIKDGGYQGRSAKTKISKRRDIVISISVAVLTLVSTISTLYPIVHKSNSSLDSQTIQLIHKRDSILISNSLNKNK